MKRYKYIKPSIELMSTLTESPLATLSSDTDDQTGGGEKGPQDGGTGGKTDLAKKFDAWATWDDDFAE